MFPLDVCVVMILRPNLDPTYLLFRNVTIISCKMKLFLRILIFCSSLMHACMHIIKYAIVGVNVLVWFIKTLDRITTTNRRQPNFRNISEYFINMRTYRQLQIMNQVANHIIRNVLPVGTLILLLDSVMMGYMIIKMSGVVPHTVTFLEVTIFAAIVGFIQIGFSLMAELMKKSSDFIRGLKLQGLSSQRKRQMRSCQPLKIWAGSYFFIRKGTPITLFGLMAYYTMSLVISV